MTPHIARAALPVRAILYLRAVLHRRTTHTAARDLPSHDQLREARAYRRHVAAAPHILAVGGRIDIVRLPR